mgnify:CR=1 FL=1
MTRQALTSGHRVGVMALVAALGLIGAEMAELATWGDMTPAFVGEMCLQLGPVIAAYVGGTMVGRDRGDA